MKTLLEREIKTISEGTQTGTSPCSLITARHRIVMHPLFNIQLLFSQLL